MGFLFSTYMQEVRNEKPQTWTLTDQFSWLDNPDYFLYCLLYAYFLTSGQFQVFLVLTVQLPEKMVKLIFSSPLNNNMCLAECQSKKIEEHREKETRTTSYIKTGNAVNVKSSTIILVNFTITLIIFINLILHHYRYMPPIPT